MDTYVAVTLFLWFPDVCILITGKMRVLTFISFKLLHHSYVIIDAHVPVFYTYVENISELISCC